MDEVRLVAESCEPRIRHRRPVTQEWVHCLSLMQQSVLLSAVRGCDGIPKRHKSKALIKWYRRCILLAAFDGEVKTSPCSPGGGSFAGPLADVSERTSQSQIRMLEEQVLQAAADDFIDSRDELPAHYQVHAMHAFQILGYKHPDSAIRRFWAQIYDRMAKAYHLWPETEEQMDARLGDDMAAWLARNDKSSTCSD